VGVYRAAFRAFSHFVQASELLSLVGLTGNGTFHTGLREFKTAVTAFEALGKFCPAFTAKVRFLMHIFDCDDLSFVAFGAYENALRTFWRQFLFLA